MIDLVDLKIDLKSSLGPGADEYGSHPMPWPPIDI